MRPRQWGREMKENQVQSFTHIHTRAHMCVCENVIKATTSSLSLKTIKRLISK